MPSSDKRKKACSDAGLFVCTARVHYGHVCMSFMQSRFPGITGGHLAETRMDKGQNALYCMHEQYAVMRLWKEPNPFEAVHAA